MTNRWKRRGKLWLALFMAVAVIAQFGYVPARGDVAEAADNGLAQKPYMGWSSYSMQVYDGPSGNWISEAKIKQMSDAMHEKLQSHGYNYINIDAGWNDGMDEYGRPLPSAALYPDGFENLVDYVHANGQKIGIYLIPGVSPDAVNRNLPIYGAPGCTIGDIVVKPYQYADYWNIGYKIDFSKPCAQKYVDSVADQIASWGVDFVKFDSVTPGSGHNDLTIDARGDVKAWSEALSRHHIWFELSWALDHNYADYWKQYANGWRVDWDVESYDRNIGMTQWANIARLFPDAELWWRDAGPGGWNDFDSLDIGNGATSGLTRDERQTAATLWAISSAQWFTGDDLTNLDDYGLQLLTNDEVIAVDQAGHPAHPVSTATNQQVWFANNGDGTYTVALFNLGSKGANVSVDWSDIGLAGSASVRDLWSRKELGAYDTGYGPVYLEPHASRLFKVTALNGTSIVNDDDTGMRYTGTWTRNGGKEQVHDAQDLSVAITDSSSAPNDSKGDNSSDNNSSDNGNSGDSGNPYAPPGVANNDSPPADGNGASVTHTVYINDNDPAIQYANRWGYSSGRSFGDYGDDVHYGEPDNDSGTEPEFTYTFTGTGIEVLSELGPSDGKMDVYIDGQLMTTADSEGSPQAGEYSAYSISDLPQGSHTLRVVRNGSGQYYLILDALKVTTDTLLGRLSASVFNKDEPADITVDLPFGASSLTGIKNGDTALQPNADYTIDGSTVTIKQAYWLQQPSGGTTTLDFGFVGGDGQSLSVAITGTSIAPATASFDKRPAAQADIAVTLTLGDGDSLTGINDGTDNLKEGEDYTVAGVVVTILKSYLASRPVGVTSLTFEFDRSDSRTLAVTVSNSASPGRYLTVNNDDPGIQYTGSWNRSSGRNLGDYKDDVQWAENNGDFFAYTFQGTGIDYITEVDQGQGDVEIFIDGVSQGTVSTYGADAHNKPQQTVYSISGLTNGFHTLKAVKKSGQFMLLDALRVQLPDLIDVSSADFDKGASAPADVSVNVLGSVASLSGISNGANRLVNGVDYTITGRQVTIKKEYLAAQPVGTLHLTFSFQGDYGDDVHSTATDGDYYQYSFKGTGIELLAPTSPDQGEMDIYIDGELKRTVDANSASRAPQQSLFSISALRAGTHTLKVVKRSGEIMLADALRFDVAPNRGAAPTGGGSSGAADPGTIDVVRSTLPDGTVKDEARLSDDNVQALIDKAKTAGAKSAALDLPDAQDEVSLTNVLLTKDSLGLLADSGLGLDLDTANVKVQISNASLQGLNDDVYFSIVPVKSTDDGQKLEQRANAATVVLAAAEGGKATLVGRPVSIETNLLDREVTLVLPIRDDTLSDADLQQLGVYIEHSDGTTEFKQGAVTAFDGGRGIRFTANKFSTFALLKLEGGASALSHEPYMQGYEGGLFKPDNSVTRAEMAAILSRVVKREATGGDRAYSDVRPGYWAAEAIAQVTRMGLMHGYADGTFKPQQPLTRAEMAALVAGLAPAGAQPGTGYADTVGHWAQAAIETVQGAGYMKGYADGTFRPASPLTRAEAVAVINRVLDRGPLYGLERSPWKDVPDSYWAVRDIEEASVAHRSVPRSAGGEQAAD
jgi:hypothetical protein